MAQVDYPAILAEAWRQHLAPRETDAPTVISTFAGCGGSSLGYSMAGYRELLAVEWNDIAVQTFKLNFPDVPVYHDDIAKLSAEECLKLAGLSGPRELDVLDGSPPCQGFSTAGKRNLEDDRNQLFREYVRLLRGLQPRMFVIENVSGMVKGNMKLVFAEVLRALRQSGYAVSVRLMDAAYFYVPQHRERLIFIGIRSDLLLKPSHPIAQSRPIILRDALEGVSNDDRTPPNVSVLKKYRWAETPRGGAHHERYALLRLDWNKPARTILKTPGSGGHMHPDEPRMLTVEELKRCASFPDSFIMPRKWQDAVNLIGNAVPPLLMRAIATHIRN